ncbi:hypothetical protein JCM8547_004499 [Rhodosporidiobolus lusitaniae]
MVAEESHIDLPHWVNTEVTPVSIAFAVIGGFFVLVGPLSGILKQKFLLSSALIAFCVGIAVGPIGLDWLSPWRWVNYDEEARMTLTFQITRVVIGIQVLFAGIDLPAAYLKREALSLTMLLLPVMICAWFASAGFVYLLVKGLTFLEALAIAACITPTDPILANAIVKGKFAHKKVPKPVRDIISAESGANDGLGYPFLFIAVFLMEREGKGGSIPAALQHWVVTTWIYQILLACVLGGVIGYLARKTLKFSHNRSYIGHEEFLAYGVGLALFVLGVVGVLGSDDVLACFIAGNSLTWKDFYRIEASENDTFQDVVDTLLDTAVFIYLGTIVPWSEYTSDFLSPWRLVVLAICILLFRRMPFLLALHKFIPAIDGLGQAVFTGWFGPIGVSAIYYAILALEVLPENRTALRATIFPVVMFMAGSSTIVHGISIPLSQAAPLALSRTRSTMSLASTKVGWTSRLRAANASDDVVGDAETDVASPAYASQAMNARTSMEEMRGGPAVSLPASAHVREEGARVDAAAGAAGGSPPSRVEFSLP